MTEEVKLILSLIGTPTTAVVAVIIYLILNPEKLDQWASLIYRLLSFISQHLGILKGSIERGRISTSIQAIINTSGQQMSKESPGVLPHMVRIEWVNEEKVESYLRNGKVIVRLNRLADQDRNIVVSTLAYLSKGLLPRSKMYIDNRLRQATEFAVAKKMFASSRGTGASHYFFTEIFEPAVNQTPQLREDVATLDELENIGFFTRVYLNEMLELGEQLWPAVPSEKNYNEVRHFTNFLHRIAKKEREEDVPLSFHGVRIKVAVLLVARMVVLLEQGVRAHERRIGWLIRNGFNVIYINGWGEPNVSFVRQLLKRAQRAGQLTVLRSYSFPLAIYRGERSWRESNRAILAVCSSNVEYLRKIQEAAQPVLEVLGRRIEAVREGRWEIVGVERRVGLGTKVALRVPNDLDVGGAIKAFLAREPGIVHVLRQELGGEPVFLLPWSSNIREFMVSALCIDPTYITDIVLDEGNLAASVYVTSEQVTGLAVGKAGWNVETASRLVGWDIQIKLAGHHGTMSPDIQRVWDVLHRFVPELSNGNLLIEAIARELGVGSKVLLRSKGEDPSMSPSMICRGNNDERLQLIRSELSDEWVTLHDWSDDPAELIVRALYPLNPRNVVDVQIDEIALEANVLVKNYRAAQRAIGINGVNVQLAERVTNWKIHVRTEETPVGQEDKRSRENVVLTILEKHIPEISDGKIEVVRIAYEPGIGAKIAVRYRETRLIPRQGIASVCMGSWDRLNAIKKDLAVSFISFVEWSEDLKKNLLAALSPLQEREVSRVELDESNKQATVMVRSNESLAKAIGSHANNVRLAQQLMDWNIHLDKNSG